MDAIFKALNDPTRRALLDALRQKDGQTLTDLEANLDMTRFGVMKHLKLLEEAHLIVTRKSGRFKYHYLNALPLQEVIDRWIEPLVQKPMARAALDLKSSLEGEDQMTEKPDFVMETFIRTTQDKLWEALTDPSHMAHYHFMRCTADGALAKTGDRQVLNLPDGSHMMAFEVRQIDPKSRIDLTFEPAWAGPEMEHSRCVYLIAAGASACKLTIEHYNVPEGQEGVGDGWNRMAAGLKTWLETGEAAHYSHEEMAV